MADLPLYSTPPEVAKILRVKPERIRRWIDRGELVAANLGDRSRPRWRIARADLVAFLRNRRAAPRQDAVPRRRNQHVADLPRRY